MVIIDPKLWPVIKTSDMSEKNGTAVSLEMGNTCTHTMHTQLVITGLEQNMVSSHSIRSRIIALIRTRLLGHMHEARSNARECTPDPRSFMGMIEVGLFSYAF